MSREDKVILAHGAGGRLSHELVEEIFVKYFGNPVLARLDDAAVLHIMQHATRNTKGTRGTKDATRNTSTDFRIALTTDSYTISPLFFPGGDIGKLAVCGTVNDLSMSGARPLYLTAAFILEEGLPLETLERVVASMAETARQTEVEIVCGDTKVVNRGGADQLFINTAGVGVVPPRVDISGSNARPGDVVLLSGPVGDHGMAIMTRREGIEFTSPLESDCAPLNGLVQAMLAASPEIHCLRDPTRGGLAATLNELATQSGVGIEVDEEAIPVREAVRGACELLGLDPLYVANEGKLVAVVPPHAAEAVLAAMRAHPYGREATVIGRVVDEHPGRVVLCTALGARRILDMLVGEQLPRIC